MLLAKQCRANPNCEQTIIDRIYKHVNQPLPEPHVVIVAIPKSLQPYSKARRTKGIVKHDTGAGLRAIDSADNRDGKAVAKLKTFAGRDRLHYDREKPNQKELIRISTDKLRRYFPKHHPVEQMKQALFKLPEERQQKWQKNNSMEQ